MLDRFMTFPGDGGLWHWLFGQFAERLLEQLAVPVVLVAVPATTAGRSRHDARARTVAAPTDRWGV